MKNLLALTVAIVSLSLVPAAAARTGGPVVWYAIDYPKNAPGYRFITDTLGGNGHPKRAASPTYRIITDTLGGSGSPPLAANAGESGFSFADAGIGAAASLGLALVVAGAGLLVMRRRGRLVL